MAFEFPRRDESTLFFPTVHVHDGEVHETARFDHTLFLQQRGEGALPQPWWRSYAPARQFATVERALGVIDGDALVYRMGIAGDHANQDFFVAA